MRGSPLKKLPLFKIIGFAAIFAIIVLLAVVGISQLRKWEASRGHFPEQTTASDTVEYEEEQYVVDDSVETFLVLFIDEYDKSAEIDAFHNNLQAEFLMLLVINNSTKQYTAIHINKNTVTDINVLGVAGNKLDTVKGRIALSHLYGNGKGMSAYNTATSVSSLLMGIKVDHYVSVTMDGVMAITDMVGGVEVVVRDDLSEIDPALTKGATVTLTGEQALTYLRSHSGIDSRDYDTVMKRQHQYVEALDKSYAQSATADDQFVAGITTDTFGYLITDRSATQLQATLEKIAEYEFMGITDIDGKTAPGKTPAEFYPDEQAVKKIVIDLFYRQR